MHINHANLRTLYTSFRTSFQGVLSQAVSQAARVATTVPSSTASEEYGWLGSFPNMREWLGDRVVHGAKSHGYSIKNKEFELTVGVPRTAIEDDQYGVYSPMMEELGRSVGAHPDQLVFGLLAAGASTLCYDGQFFFDTDHPVLNAAGVPVSQANWDNNSGSGTPWYLLDVSRSLKPIIHQERKKPNFVSKTAETDDNVFNAKEYVYGVDCRRNVGFGLWQLAYGSRKTLDETNLIAAHTAMTARKGDYDRPLGIRPTVLVVPPALEWSARKIVNASTLANGADNVLKGVVEVMSSPWL
ncbi:MAG: Mu-like prophage major head subunit gpT family protein [Panacagrimonas sp.]